MNALEIEGATVTYDGRVVLDGVSLAAAPGECVAVVGRSGTGKSTLLRVASGQQRPDFGTTRVRDGAGWFDLHDGFSSGRPAGLMIGYVDQDPVAAHTASRKVVDLVEDPLVGCGMPRRERRRAALAALARADLPAALSERVAGSLSGGQLQRVAVARALAAGPPVLLLDEPTSSLDRVARAAVLATLRAVRDDGGVALVFVTHDLAAAADLATRTLRLAGGRLATHS